MNIVLATALALLLVSPAFAAKKKEITVDKPTCMKMDQVKAKAKDGIKVEYEITGDNLARLNAYVAKKTGQTAPAGMDGLVILSQNDTWIGVLFVSGCVAQLFPVNPESFKKLLNNSQEDGQI